MRTVAILFAAAVLLGTLSAGAQGRDATAAEVLFREGREAMGSGDYARACAKFRESNRLDPAPGTVLNIGGCEEKLGHVATAWSLFSEVTQRLPSSDERYVVAAQRVAALEPRLPRLTISLAPGAPAGARVFRDGVELKAASLDTALPVDPGDHEIAVEAPGRARKVVHSSLRESERKKEIVDAGPVQDKALAGKPKHHDKTWGWVLGGVGVAGLGVGAVTGVMVLGKKSTVDDNCDSARRCNQTGIDAADSGRTLGTISGASFIIGAIATTAGAYILLSGDDKEHPTTALGVGPGQLHLVRRF